MKIALPMSGEMGDTLRQSSRKVCTLAAHSRCSHCDQAAVTSKNKPSEHTNVFFVELSPY
jgi:hypothetical protein